MNFALPQMILVSSYVSYENFIINFGVILYCIKGNFFLLPFVGIKIYFQILYISIVF